ncbi:hypothetical protein CRYUN_Cryun30bG0089600 [Craigia yunnanensis]
MIMGLTGDSKSQLLSQLAELVNDISGLPECKNMHGNLVHRIKLLSPLFEELRNGNEEMMIKVEEIKGFELLMVALDYARELLQLVNEGSKLYQIISSMFAASAKYHIFCVCCICKRSLVLDSASFKLKIISSVFTASAKGHWC